MFPQFEEHNPIIDVVIICLGQCFLVIALAKFEAGTSNEKSLSDVDLSSFPSLQAAGSGANSKITISVRKEDGEVMLWIDDQPVQMDTLEAELKRMDGIAQVALRRGRAVSIATEDQIIAACRRADIRRISLIVKDEEGVNP